MYVLLLLLFVTLLRLLIDFGFRKGLSCETQLCATYHDLAKTAEYHSTNHAIILDFKKAFDKVPHALLLEKLRLIPDINPTLVNWIQDFLTNRSQQVVLRGEFSKPAPVTSGVPQGSVLGPTLFLLYINDLPVNLTCRVSLYADDTLIYQQINTDNDIEVFQENINAVEQWSRKWKMPFNTSKCHAMCFGENNLQQPNYMLDSSPIPWVENTKYLGVILQHNLNFDKHISLKTEKAGRILGAIKYTLQPAPEKSRLLAYTSLCRPVLEYADTVWDPTNKTTIDSIENIQRRAVRFISALKGRESVSDARDELSLPTLARRRQNHRVALLHKVLQNEEKHNVLSSSYDEIVNNRSKTTMVTRAASRGEPTSIYASSSVFHNSFLPRTIRDMRVLPGHQQ